MFKDFIFHCILVITSIILSLVLLNIIFETQQFFSSQHTVQVWVDDQKVFEGPAYKIRATDRSVKIYKDGFKVDRIAEYVSPRLVIKTVGDK